MAYIYDRTPWTSWKIILRDIYQDDDEEDEIFDRSFDFLEYTCSYRSGLKEDRECEVFSLFLKDLPEIVSQLFIFNNGDTRCTSHIPMSCLVDRQKKTVTVNDPA